ncbi:MAG: prepilin-type N-terminal cleavage/methylation domain-containing protein [Sporichthyaceae bacterium]|nr:prepilin-type N-terminal cleavage/methylation domain-containing protein [Sporichthyaceae bacterium]
MSHRTSRGGFTLVEALVAIVLLSVGALALGSLLARSSRMAVASASTIHGTAALSTEVGRLNALPFDQLPAAGETCTTVSTPPFPHTLCTRLTDVSATVKEVRVRVTPSAAGVRADTVNFQRTLPGGNPVLTTP